MGLKDLLITPIYLVCFSILLFLLKNALTQRRTSTYFLPGFFLKIFGAIALGFIYQFYYSGGDTFNYWRYGSSHIWRAFKDSPQKAFRMIFSDTISPDLWEYYSSLWFINSDSALYVVRVTGFFDILTLHTYSATALFFAVFSFSGSWALFTVLCKKYPNNERNLFIAIFLIPSVVLWGSGIMKDTLTIGSLFWIIWAVIQWFEFKSRGVKEVLVFTIAFYVIYKVKVYVLISLIPCLLFYLLFLNLKKIKSASVRILVAPIITFVFIVFGYFAVLKIGETNERYQLDKIAHWSSVTANDLRYWTGKDAGSGYSLGHHDGTWQGMLRMAPGGIFTAIFRPFIWEASNLFMLMNALESSIMLVVFFRFLLRNRWHFIKRDPFLLFCLMFLVIFAFAVGVSTFNFGTLSRYRIPLIPFFLIVFTVKDQPRSFVKLDEIKVR